MGGIKLMKNLILYQIGQSLLEVIIAMAVFSLIVAGIASLVLGGFAGLEQGGEQTQAAALAQEALEAVKSIQGRAWNELRYSQSAVALSAGKWVFSGEGTDEQIGQFSRVISFSNVCRNASQDIVECPGVYQDVHSKKIIAVVDWTIRPGIDNFVQAAAYLTNWDSRDWLEDTLVDFNDGNLNGTATSSSLGDGNGAVVLSQQ